MNRLLLVLLLIPTLLQAEEQRWYQVEVIIYAHNNTDYHESELWPIDYTLPQLDDIQELSPAPKGSKAISKPVPFSLVRPEALQLGGAATRIKQASDVDLVLHFGWLQPGLEEKKAVAIHIHDKMLEQRTSQESDSELPKLDGTLRLTLSRYLHLESDLIWRDPISDEELARLNAMPVFENGETETLQNGDATIELNGEESNGMLAESGPAEPVTQLPLITHHTYRMQQSRRMRSNELHYIDHPRFSIITIATRYEPQQEKSAAAASD